MKFNRFLFAIRFTHRDGDSMTYNGSIIQDHDLRYLYIPDLIKLKIPFKGYATKTLNHDVLIRSIIIEVYRHIDISWQASILTFKQLF